MKIKYYLLILISVLTLGYSSYYTLTHFNINPNTHIGQTIDQLDGVHVYYNGGVNHVLARNTTDDGYNLGLQYQCVEFVKRYYYEHYQHKMPDTYGHAKDFYDATVKNGHLNPRRNLIQFSNGLGEKPKKGDLLVYQPSLWNPYGHVAIVAEVQKNATQLEIIQQNAGPFASSRAIYPLSKHEQGWHIQNDAIVGWLRLIR